jgi:hypothetical protein
MPFFLARQLYQYDSVEMTDASWEVPFQGKLSSPCSANEMKDLSFEIDVSEVPHTVNIDCIIVQIHNMPFFLARQLYQYVKVMLLCKIY